MIQIPRYLFRLFPSVLRKLKAGGIDNDQTIVASAEGGLRLLVSLPDVSAKLSRTATSVSRDRPASLLKEWESARQGHGDARRRRRTMRRLSGAPAAFRRTALGAAQVNVEFGDAETLFPACLVLAASRKPPLLRDHPRLATSCVLLDGGQRGSPPPTAASLSFSTAGSSPGRTKPICRRCASSPATIWPNDQPDPDRQALDPQAGSWTFHFRRTRTAASRDSTRSSPSAPEQTTRLDHRRPKPRSGRAARLPDGDEKERVTVDLGSRRHSQQRAIPRRWSWNARAR